MADIDIVTVINPEQYKHQSRPYSQKGLGPGEVLEGTGFKVRDFKDLFQLWSRRYGLEQSFDAWNTSYPSLTRIKLSREEITRWEMAWRAVPAFPEIGARDETSFPAILTSRIKDGPKMGVLFKEYSIALSFGAAASLYGGLHVLAWSSHFNSSTEQMLWRVSASLVMGGIPVGFLLSLLLHQCERKLWEGDPPFLVGLLLFALICLMGLALVAVAAAYIAARAYLVAECFINLSHLSAEVFDIPSWTGYFPHIS